MNNIDKISKIIGEMSKEDRRKYPNHLYEPERIEIARQLAIKEYYKLLPFLTKEQFDKFYDEMLNWFVGYSYELAPVHDFWNFVGSFTETLKLKATVMYLTSENITWFQDEVDTRKFTLYWGVGDLENSGKKEGQWSYDDVKTGVLENPERLKINKKISDEKSSDTKISRDNFPIIALKDENGKYKLLDGNRRVMRAWLYGNHSIKVWVGQIESSPPIHNHWVSPSFFRRLLAEYKTMPTQEVKDSIRSQLKILFAMSEVAKYNFTERCMHMPEAKELAKDLVET